MAISRAKGQSRTKRRTGHEIYNLPVNDAVQSHEEICIGITQLLCAETF